MCFEDDWFRLFERGRDIGIYIAFIGINIIGTFILYWFARVPKILISNLDVNVEYFSN